jgi:hypothetical protein
MMSRGWLLILCAYLALWQPLAFAAEVATSIDTLGMRGLAGLLELVAHGAVTALAVAAGWGLWMENPGARALAEIAIPAVAATVVQSLYWTRLPHDVMPGDRLPLAILAMAHATGWMMYLRKSRRVRSLLPTD